MLIILPCAGGSTFGYTKWIKYLEIETMLLDYAGHWTRIDEKLNSTYEEMIEDMLFQIEKISDLKNDNIYFFGHSMGAMVCWDIVKRIFNLGENAVQALFLASMWTPEDLGKNRKLQLSESEIKNFLLEIRQIPANMFINNYFMERVFPAICNDFNIFSRRKSNEDDSLPINIPIYCITGNQDNLVDLTLIKKWQKYSLNQCKCWERPGNHFFLNDKDNIKWICKLINKISGSDYNEKKC